MCRELGFSAGLVRPGPVEPSGRFALGKALCSGAEGSLSECVFDLLPPEPPLDGPI